MKTLRQMMDLIESAQVAESNDHSLKKLWDRYARHLPAARGDTADVDHMEKSSKICRDIKNYVQTNYGEEAVDNMERYADRYLDEQQLDETSDEAVAKIDQLYKDKQ